MNQNEVIIKLSATQEVSVICAIENAIKKKEKLIKDCNIQSMVDFQKGQIENLKAFLENLKTKKTNILKGA